MGLWIKQKVFSWGDRFTVKDDAGQDRYFVQGEVFTIGKKLHVHDAGGVEIAFIQQKVLTFLPRFFVYRNGALEAEIVKEFTFFRPVYRIEGPGWEIQGDVLQHEYGIFRGGMPIVSIRKEWFTWGDSYLLDVADPKDEVLALAVVLAIDAVQDSRRSSTATFGG